MKQKSKVYIPNFEIYSIDGKIAVYFVGDYENLTDDFSKALKDLGISEFITLPVSNADPGKGDQNYRQFYNERTRDMIAEWYEPEIAAFGYKFYRQRNFQTLLSVKLRG